MDFKVEIKCGACFCKFEMRPVNFKDKDSLECPNCGQALPDDVFQHLKTGVLELGQVPERIPETDVFDPDCEFKLSVKSFSVMQDLLHQN